MTDKGWHLKNGSGWKTAQWVKGLLHKREDLSAIPRAHVKRLGFVVGTCNLSAKEAAAGELWGTLDSLSRQ